MGNIANIPIIMYVDGRNLTLDESTASELIENNKYNIKIYTNENLDKSVLVRKTENDQSLSGSINFSLDKEVKRLLRSKDEDELKWWVYLEKGEEKTVDNKPIYNGIVKTYKYEEVSTIFSNTKRRDKVSIDELGLLKVTLGEDFNTLTILSNPATDTILKNDFTDEVFKGGILTTDFQNIPEPELRQVDVEFPKEITLKIKLEEEEKELGLDLNNYSNNFNFPVKTSKQDISKLSFNSYSEEEGIYYYSKKITGSSKNVGLKNSSFGDTTTYTVEFEIKVECKINENNFSDFSLVVYLNLKGLKEENTSTTSIEEEIQEDNNEPTLISDSADQEPDLGNEVVSEPKEEIENQAGEEFDIDYSLNENLEISLNVMEIIIIPNNLKFLTKEFDMEEIFLQETGDDYANIYVVKDVLIEEYNQSGLNEIGFGIQNSEASYETNVVKLVIIPGISGTSWPVTDPIRNLYYNIGDESLDAPSRDTGFTDLNGNTCPREIDSLYMQIIKPTSGNETIKFFKWVPSISEFEIFKEITIEGSGGTSS